MAKATRVHSTPRPTAPSCKKPSAKQIDAAPVWDDPANWPEDVFACRIDGVCLEPVIPDHAAVVFKKSESIQVGDIVGVWFRPDVLAPKSVQCIVKRLKTNLPPKFGPGSDVGGVVYFEQLNPPSCFRVKSEYILAMHKAIGFVAPGAAVDGAVDSQDMLAIG